MKLSQALASVAPETPQALPGRAFTPVDAMSPVRRLSLAGDATLPMGAAIDCLVHVSDKLSVCSVAEFAKLKRHQTEKSRVIILSSAITVACVHWDHETLREFSMRNIFSSPCLQRCLETSSANNASAVVYSCPR